MSETQKDTFLAINGPEIRNQLNAIIGTVELMLETPLNPEQTEYLQVLKSSSRALLELMSSGMDLSNVQEHKPVDAPPSAALQDQDYLPLNILLVDDAPENRMLFNAFFKHSPHTMSTVENGAIAIDMYTSGDYDLILMDIQMPVKDGLTATKEIRQWEKNNGVTPCHIIALTSHAMQEDVEKSIAAGCNAHLTKPINKKKLFDVVEHYAKIKKSGKQE
jgi:CheY-like chemotaxis protein